MPEYVHVRIKDTGAKGSILTSRFDPKVYEKTGEEALDNHGEPRRWKSKTTVAKAAASKKSAAKKAAAPESGQQADTEKESD